MRREMLVNQTLLLSLVDGVIANQSVWLTGSATQGLHKQTSLIHLSWQSAPFIYYPVRNSLWLWGTDQTNTSTYINKKAA